MADSVPASRFFQTLSTPWPSLGIGLVLTGASAAVLAESGRMMLPMILLGLLATGIAITLRPQSSLVLALAAISGLLARQALTWDSGRLLLTVLTALAAIAAVVLLLPSVLRRAVVSLIIVFHFGAIISAVSSVPPNPWLASVSWSYVYKPYLEFMYMNNAYHFYSPEPGPACLLWFYVKYEDGSSQWYKIPNRDENPVALEYQRRLSLCESINQVQQPGPVPEHIRYRRRQAAELQSIEYHPLLLEHMQYRPAHLFARRMAETYTRYVARTVKHPTNPDLKVTGVRLYRVIHNLLWPQEVVQRIHPEKPSLYFPYYHGEFTAEGVLKDPEDPCLYWLIPIYEKPKPARAKDDVVKAAPANDCDPSNFVNMLQEHLKLDSRVSAASKE